MDERKWTSKLGHETGEKEKRKSSLIKKPSQQLRLNVSRQDPGHPFGKISLAESVVVYFLRMSEKFSGSEESGGRENATLPLNPQQPVKALFLAIYYIQSEPLTCSFTHSLEFDTGWTCFSGPLGQKNQAKPTVISHCKMSFPLPNFAPTTMQYLSSYSQEEYERGLNTAQQVTLPSQTTRPLVTESWPPMTRRRPTNSFAQTSERLRRGSDLGLS